MATKEKKPRKAKKPEWTLEELDTFTKRIGGLEDAIRKHDKTIEEKRQDLKSAKELRAGCVSEMRRLAFEKNHPEAHPLFNGKPSANGNGKHEPEDESWKLVKLEELTSPAIPKALLQKLHDANLYTLGELATWTAQDGGRKRISDINGIGPAMAEKIELATTGFWEKRAKQ